MADFEVMPVGTRRAMDDAARTLRVSAAKNTDLAERERQNGQAEVLEDLLVQKGVERAH